MDFGNLGALMKIGSMKAQFEANHPKVIAFFKSITSKPIEPDTVIEIKFTRPGEEGISCNMKLTQSDIDMLKELKGLRN